MILIGCYFSESLPELYQNFASLPGVNDDDVGGYGGSVTLADFCPFVQEFTWTGGGEEEGRGRGTRCDNSDNAPASDANYALEQYGDNARCFKQTQPWEEKSCTMIKKWTRYGSGCYDYTCGNGLVNIIVRNISFSCYTDNLEIPLELIDADSEGVRWIHKGNVVCPR